MLIKWNRRLVATALSVVLIAVALVLVAQGLPHPEQADRAPSAQTAPSAPTEDSVAARIIKEFQASLPAWIKEQDVPGMAVAVVDDKQILWQAVYGQTSRTQGKPVTPRTLFSIQSMSKSFTALAVLAAVQDGLLDLDRPITEYLPDFKVHSRFEENPEKKMTLRHLLSHRAGFTHEAPVGSNYDSRPHTFAEHTLSISDTWLRYPVGYRYSYSNLGIDLAGWILEKKTGVPFAKYVREKVLAPLGMNDSTLDVEAILKAEDRAIGHVAPSVKVACGIPVEVPMLPAGGVYTNILDMARYLMFHINKGRVGETQMLTKDLIEAMHTVQFPEKHQRYGYGLGLVTYPFGVMHGGGGYGFTSFMVMCPELKLGVVGLINSEAVSLSGPVSRAGAIISSAIAPPGRGLGESAAAAKDPVPATDERIKRLAGSYAGGAALGAKDGAFGITLGKQFNPLTFFADDGEIVGSFGKSFEVRVKPRLGEGEPGALTVTNRLTGTCEYYDFHKPEPAADKPGPNRPEWKAFLGTYKQLTWGRAVESMVNVAITDGYLTVNGSRCREYRPGLFFTYDGEALDFRGTIATFGNIQLIRTGR